MKDFFLVSSVSVLAKEDYSVKAFFLRDGDSWCVFPAGLPSSRWTSSPGSPPSLGVAAASISIYGYRRIIWCWTYGRFTASISGNVACLPLRDGRTDGNPTFKQPSTLTRGHRPKHREKFG